ncbi:MAG: outer membrane protein assembly factor BamD [Myxococcales bacterium]|jgi:outer membrane protein assembly factor BamD
MISKLPMLLAAFALLAGCASLDSTGEPSYADDSELNFSRGQKALDDGRYLEALKYFEHVRYKFPYSSHAALADLAIGDTYFSQEKYIEAVDAYRNFLKLRPNHPKADYAEFRVALSYYKDIPSDFFIFPPSSEKDQTAVRKALDAFGEFVERHPSSEHAAEAKRLYDDVRLRLARHELYVADFYIRRERWRAAVGRLDYLLEKYPGTALEGEALFKLGSAHLKLGEKEKARETLERLVRELPNDPYRADAQSLLASLT